MTKYLKQLVLANGEEIITHIVAWDVDNDNSYSVIKNPVQLVFYDHDDGTRYFGFKPFMTFQSYNDYQVLNKNHIVSVMNPNEAIVEQYFDYCGNLERDEVYTKFSDGQPEINDDEDSSDTNVLQFKPTLH